MMATTMTTMTARYHSAKGKALVPKAVFQAPVPPVDPFPWPSGMVINF